MHLSKSFIKCQVSISLLFFIKRTQSVYTTRVIGVVFTLRFALKKCRRDRLSRLTTRRDILKLEILTVNTIQMVI